MHRVYYILVYTHTHTRTHTHTHTYRLHTRAMIYIHTGVYTHTQIPCVNTSGFPRHTNTVCMHLWPPTTNKYRVASQDTQILCVYTCGFPRQTDAAWLPKTHKCRGTGVYEWCLCGYIHGICVCVHWCIHIHTPHIYYRYDLCTHTRMRNMVSGDGSVSAQNWQGIGACAHICHICMWYMCGAHTWEGICVYIHARTMYILSQ